MRSIFLPILATTLTACAATVPSTLELALAPAAACGGWTTGADLCAAPLDVFEDRDLARPIAHVEHPGSYRVRWSLPDDAADRAEVSLDADGFAISGWVRLTDREFPLGASQPLGPVLRAPAGMPVRVVGRLGAALRVEMRTPFRAPRLVRTTIACDALAMAAPEPTSTPEGALVGLRGTVELADAAGGSVALTITADEDALFRATDERDGHTHVVSAQGDARLVIDGWARSSSVARDVEPWSDSGCDPTDTSDSAPDATTIRETAIDVGAAPGDTSRLAVAAGAEVRVIERRQGWVAILPTTSGVEAPAGAWLWIPADAIAAP